MKETPTANLEGIVERICQLSGTKQADIQRRYRKRSVADARHLAVWIAWRLGFTTKDLGDFFYHGYSASVTYAISAMNNRRCVEPWFKKETDEMLAHFNNTP